MDQLEVGKLAAAHGQDIAFGAIILIGGIGAVAFRSLTNDLKRYDSSTWEALGRPQLFSKKSMKDELTFFWFILACKYRDSEIRKIRILGDLRMLCSNVDYSASCDHIW